MVFKPHVGEVQLALQPGWPLGECETLGQLLRLLAGRDDLLVESLLFLRALDVIGPHGPEHIQLVAAGLAEFCRVNHAARQIQHVPSLARGGERAVHHTLVERASGGVRQLILRVDVLRKLGSGIHANQADLRVPAPDKS